jgi:hypothetical protein
MSKNNWLICGSRGKFSKDYVLKKLDMILNNKRVLYENWKPDCIIEGCCPNSADVYAEKWARNNVINILHYPSTSGNYLKRNIEMCEEATLIIAFWDGFSYGTAHTIAQATMKGIPVIVFSRSGGEL